MIRFFRMSNAFSDNYNYCHFISDNLFVLFKIILFWSKKKNIELDYEKKKVSIIIAARNEEKNIPQLLTSLMNQTYPKELFEVIVVDDDSSDRTAEVVLQFKKVGSYPSC